MTGAIAHSSRANLSSSIVKLLLICISTLSSISSHPISKFVHLFDDNAPEEEPGSTQFWWKLGLSVALILGGGVFAGLTIGLMGQDLINLQVLAESGEGREKKHAKRVLNLLKRGKHWVLVTLLLSNVLTNETLPIVMDSILPGGIYAIAISTVSIVIFGEIIPQALCVRYGLAIGAAFVPPMLVMMYLMYPIAYPIAKLLDYLLGDDEGTVYKKAGLKTLVTLHKTLGADRLNEDEVTIITAVLDLKDKKVSSIMTPIEDVFTMSADTILDEPMVDTILKEGYSRIPIFQPGNPANFVGMLLVKILITYDPEDRVPVSSFSLATLPECRPEVSCLDILNFFQEGKSHMVLISENPGKNTAERRVTSNASALGTKALLRPANVAAAPNETKNRKVIVKPTTSTMHDSLNPANTESTGLRRPGDKDRHLSIGYGATSEAEAMHENLAFSPSATSQSKFDKANGNQILPQHRPDEVVEDDDAVSSLRSSSSRALSPNKTSRIRSGSVVETTYTQPDGTRKTVVEMDHTHDQQSHVDSFGKTLVNHESKNGIQVPDVHVENGANDNEEDEDSPLLQDKSKKKKKKKGSKK
ncbi:hypothetical protein MRB53_040819 [Persea americana]|nr:hypothetical protein MRB53_040819 [Persea americana]